MYVHKETTSRDSFWVDLVFRRSWNVAGRSNFVGARHKAGARLVRQLQVGRDGAFSES